MQFEFPLSSSLNGHCGQILKPADCTYLNEEGEYAVLIGRTPRNVTPEEAWNCIEGFCPARDMETPPRCAGSRWVSTRVCRSV